MNGWLVIVYDVLRLGNTYFENQTINLINSTIKVLTWPENKFAGIITSFP